MKKLLLIVLAGVLLALAGCAAVDYFKNPDNQNVLFDAGLTCFMTPNTPLKIGAVYVFQRQPTGEISAAHSGEFVIGCQGKLFTVQCDLTKKPQDKPCSNLRTYLLKTNDPAVPVSWLEQ